MTWPLLKTSFQRFPTFFRQSAAGDSLCAGFSTNLGNRANLWTWHRAAIRLSPSPSTVWPVLVYPTLFYPSLCRSPFTTQRRVPNNMSFYDLSCKTLEGEEFSFKQLEGQVVLIVNVASKCGFTSQYTGLESLYQKFKDHNVKVLGFPCNQFGNQEPGDAEEIRTFCTTKYQLSFPIMEKVDVNGANEHPVYNYLKAPSPKFLGMMSRIKWNFEKFLINQKGEVVHRYLSTASPESIAADIEKLLGQTPAEGNATSDDKPSQL
ncbi:Glutathione peroxidase 2 [Dispira simplex]|nr:Glutathione peroxidase 2 [Dispira simplex]